MADDTEACATVATDIDEGRLRDAEARAHRHHLCGQAKKLIADRRAQAAALVDAARATPASAAQLAAAARRIDDGNVQAAAIVLTASPPPVSPPPLPPVTFTPPVAVPGAPNACAAAKEALTEGRYTEAGLLLDALGDEEKCVAGVKADLAEQQAAQPLERAWRSLSSDRLMLLLLVATLVLAGAILARATSRGARGSRGSGFRRPAIVSGIVLAVGVLAPALAQLSPRLVEDLPGGWAGTAWDAVTAASALAFGFLWVRHLRATAPTVVEVIDATGKSVDNSTLGTLVVSEVAEIADSSPAGLFAVKGGTDLTDSGVTAALDTVTQKYLKAAVTVWRALTTGLGDRVRISLVGTDTDPVAALLIRRGARTLYEERLDTHELRVDRAKASAGEQTSVTADLATAVAARIVLASLGVIGAGGGGTTSSLARLYGVRDPRSLAAAAVAARHTHAGRHTEAIELFSRAHGIDPQNLSARYGRDVSTLRRSASGADGLAALEDLEGLERLLRRTDTSTPLFWRCRYNAAVHRANRVLTGGVPKLGTPARALLSMQVLALRTLIRELGWVIFDENVSAPDRYLALRLVDLAAPAVTGLSALDGRAATRVRRQLEGYESASRRGMVNVANGYALLYRHAPGRGDAKDLRAAVGLMRLAGLEVGGRADIAGDPVLKLLHTTEPYRVLMKDWGLAAANPYAELACIGADTAGKLEADYPTAKRLRAALRHKPGTVFVRAGVGAENGPWWTGALDWLVAGRAAATINAYQAAGIRDATEAARLGDSAVVDLLHRRGMDDKSVTVPDARTRSLMEEGAEVGRDEPGWGRRRLAQLAAWLNPPGGAR